ncbi:DUF1501 domain-containing protein [Dyella sp. 2RAB6]|uniref:DUF1501 domain-containing protein n=1 Tax=Dyella sp. 2RAB6 TaxID=3232992 RepID=UPI003F916BF4
MPTHSPSRRSLLKAGLAVAGALALGPFDALASPRERPALVVLWLNGGPAGLFNSADAFLANGAFDVRSGNVRALGHRLYVDAASLGALPAVALAHMAAVPFRHGLYSHNDARVAMLQSGPRSQLLRMAAALPASPLPCVIVNRLGVPVGVAADPPAERGIVCQHVGAFADAGLAAAALGGIRHAYGVTPGRTAVDDLPATFAAVEALVRADAGVVFAQVAFTGREDRQFDTHHDDGGKLARQIMAPITPGLSVFLQRMLTLRGRNVVTLLTGEFSRTLPGADHAKGGTATVIGKYVRTGSAGRQLPDGSPPEDAAAPEALWAYLAAALRVDGATPFGAHPHPQLLV